MNASDFNNSVRVFIEIGQETLHVLDGSRGLDLPLERDEHGRLSGACRERLAAGLRAFLKRPPWLPRQRALCAIGARGVSLRRITVPATSPEELERVVRLQVENHFPLRPEELAWGYRVIDVPDLPSNGGSAVRDLLVVAVKKDPVEDYAQLMADCGLAPVFTAAILARQALCPEQPSSYAVLEIGPHHSEFATFEHHVPVSVRVIPWGSETVGGALQERFGASGEAAGMRQRGPAGQPGSGACEPHLRAVIEAACEALAAIPDRRAGQTLYLAARGADANALAPAIEAAVPGARCRALDMDAGPGRTAATLGLREAGRRGGASPLVELQVESSSGARTAGQPVLWKWAALAVALAILSLAMRYVEPLFMQQRLAAKLATLKAHREKLPAIDRELSFLEYLKTNQPPYLDTLTIIANATPGARFDSVSINRRGDLSLRGSMRDAQQVADFRSKLIASGFFSTVTVEDQTPTPDRQKLIVRITGQLKPAKERKPLALDALAPAATGTRSTAAEVQGGPAPVVRPASAITTRTSPAGTQAHAQPH